ncbi:MAG: DUF3656 domain-containing protein [Arcicella sp.]|nr:DUF3656 domain-containing protein [Arcicella sp.]
MVEREDSAIRKIGVKLLFYETEDGFSFDRLLMKMGITSAAAHRSRKKNWLKTTNRSLPNIKKNLSKTGNTPFIVDEIVVDFTENWFLPISKINEIVETVLEQLMDIRVSEYHREELQITKTDHPYPVKALDFTYNVQ